MHNLHGLSSRFYLDVEWGQVHGRAAGSAADPAVVFIHQSPLSSAIYEPVLGLLAAEGFYAVALDTPGFGMSDQADPNWSIADLAQGLWQAVDALGVGSADIVGQHTGATIAIEAYLQQPVRVRSLILQGLPLYDEEERAEKQHKYAPGYARATDGSHLLTIWHRILGLYPEISAADADRQVLEYLSIGPDYGTAYRAVFDYRIDIEALQKAPIRFLHGSGDLVERMSSQIREAFPLAPFETIAGGTDFVSIELPEAFMAALSRNIRSEMEKSE